MEKNYQNLKNSTTFPHLKTYFTYIISFQVKWHITFQVNDVFGFLIEETAQQFHKNPKMWRRKIAQRAQARLQFFVAQPASSGRTFTVCYTTLGLPHFYFLSNSPLILSFTISIFSNPSLSTTFTAILCVPVFNTIICFPSLSIITDGLNFFKSTL